MSITQSKRALYGYASKMVSLKYSTEGWSIRPFNLAFGFGLLLWLPKFKSKIQPTAWSLNVPIAQSQRPTVWSLKCLDTKASVWICFHNGKFKIFYRRLKYLAFRFDLWLPLLRFKSKIQLTVWSLNVLITQSQRPLYRYASKMVSLKYSTEGWSIWPLDSTAKI